MHTDRRKSKRLPRSLVAWSALALLGMLIALAPLPEAAAAPEERTIRVEAGSFAYNPGVIVVNRGDRVTLELISNDVVHGLYIDGYDLEVIAEPGQSARLSFLADRGGTFRLRCSVTCGDLHPFMIGKLKVGPGGLFWRASGLAVLAVLAGVLYFKQLAGTAH